MRLNNDLPMTTRIYFAILISFPSRSLGTQTPGASPKIYSRAPKFTVNVQWQLIRSNVGWQETMLFQASCAFFSYGLYLKAASQKPSVINVWTSSVELYLSNFSIKSTCVMIILLQQYRLQFSWSIASLPSKLSQAIVLQQIYKIQKNLACDVEARGGGIPIIESIIY